MKIPKMISTFFILPQGVPKRTANEERNRDRNIVKRFARGNVRLQEGKYVTEQDVRDSHDRIRRHKFGE